MNAASGGDGSFLHLKFGLGRPPPHEHELEDGSALLFAHEIELDPATHSRNLHETLRTDVQRAGIARWLEQNFKEDAYIHDVVHRREGDRGMFALVTKNWARSVGDPKLHLSLYVYQDHMHVATWHAYSDRSVSYSRVGDENVPPPGGGGSDPYSTPEALEAAAAAALSSASKELDKDDGRPRFDRPAALPTDSSDLEDVDEVPFKPEDVVPVAKNSNSRSARSARKQAPPPAPEPESDGFSERQSKNPSRRPAPNSESESESESHRSSSDDASRSPSPSPSPSPTPSPPPPPPSKRSTRRAPRPSSDDDAESPSSEAGGPAYPIVKSQPLGKSRSDREADSPPPHPSPSPKKRSERGRDRTPVSPVGPSPSPPPAVSRKGETDRLAQQRERSRRRARPAAAPEPEPEPSPPSRSPSPVRNSRTERGRRSARAAAPPSELSAQEESEKPIADVRRRDRSARRPKPARSPSPSRSETPPTKPKMSTEKPAVEAKKDRVHQRASRSESRSPSPPVRSAKTQSKRSTRHDSEAETLKTEDERPHRGRSRAPVATSNAPPPPPQLDRKPSWRSVSRNRHRRNGSDSSGDDTLVRGNLVDADLDIPAGGEATLLTAKRRASITERRPRPRRDDSFDPEQVQQPPRPVVEAPKQTATAVLGGWIKTVGTLLKPEVEPAQVAAADSEAEEELEARSRRKAERAERRKVRAARRAARLTDASAFEDTDADRTASEYERTGRSARRRPPHEDQSRRSRRQAETEEPAPKPARPALRERAMSFSATLDSGFKNLRESVNKIVSGADEQPDSASSPSEGEELADRRRSRHRAHSRKRDQDSEHDTGPEQDHHRRRKTVEEVPDQRRSRDEERRSRSERPEPTDTQRKLRERSRRREVEPEEDRQDNPKPRPKSTLVASPSDEDAALLLRRRAKESAHVRITSAIVDEDAADLPTRSSSRAAAAAAAESSSRAARQTRQEPRFDDSSSPERPSSRHTPGSDAAPRQQAEHGADRVDVAAERTASRIARNSSSALADSGTANSNVRTKYVDGKAAPDRERPRQDYEKERRDHSVLRPRPSSSAHQSTQRPSNTLRSDFSDAEALPPSPRRRPQVGQVALDDNLAPVEQVRSPLPSSSLSAFSPSPSTISDFAASEQQQQQRRSRPPTSRLPADAEHSRGRNHHHPGRGNLTDEEEESRFVAARGSSSTAIPTSSSDRRIPSRTTPPARKEGEYLPPIPAPAPLPTRTLSAGYDSGPLRPRPHRAQPQQPLSPGQGAAGPRAGGTASKKHHTSSLPRASSFSRSQPAFKPSSGAGSADSSDSDSDFGSDSGRDSNDDDAEATSDPDSVAFRRRRPRRRRDRDHRPDQPHRAQTRMGDDWNSRGSDDDDDDDDDELAVTPFSSRPPLPLTASSASPSMVNYNTRRLGDAPFSSSSSAAPSSSSSRTNMFGPPATTKSRTMVSSRPTPPPLPRMSGYPAAAPPETADRGGWRDLQSGSSASLAYPGHDQMRSSPLSLGSADQGSGNSASFDRLTAKGRESGSVQLFGRHNAPVSRRMARRLGMS